MDFKIRKMKETEYPLLKDFLYEAIFVPDGVELPPKSIVDAPELQVYISDFGSEPDDIVLILEDLQKDNPSLKEITLNSSPYGKGFYLHLGFVALSEEQEIDGIRFAPMKYEVC